MIEIKYDIKIHKFAVLLSTMYVAALLLTAVLVHKMIQIGSLSISAGTFVFPFSYFFGDVIAEVYGYKISRQLIWSAFICMFIFDIGSAILTHTPPPVGWHYQADYSVVLGPLPRIFLGDFIAMNAGAFINAYMITKFKILTRGKYFWLRSLGSTTVGEGVFTFLAFTIMFLGVTTFKTYIEAMSFSYLFKVCYALLAVYPATLLVRFLKHKERLDVYDYNTNFNPFRVFDT